MKQLPLITIGIPTYNSAWGLPKVLDALLKFQYDPRALHIVFVDNNSSDDTRALISQFIQEHCKEYRSIEFEQCSCTIPEARNIILKRAEASDFIFFLDSDVLAPPDTLTRLLRHFETDPTLGMASISVDRENARRRARFLFDGFKVSDGLAHAYKVSGSCVLIAKEAVLKVGPYNTHLKVHEDGEYCYRMRRSGYKLVIDFSSEAINLKEIQATPKYYLRFISNSADSYIEYLKLGSPMHILKYLTSLSLLLSPLLIVSGLPSTYLLPILSGLILLAFFVNTNRRVLDDGSTVKWRYFPAIGLVLTSLVITVVLVSLLKLTVRGWRRLHLVSF